MFTKQEKDSLANVIYERYSIGEITLDEREDLLRELNNKYIKENTIKEKVDIDEDVLDKLRMFKEAAYEKYANGEITLEMREELINKATNEFSEDIVIEGFIKTKIDEIKAKKDKKNELEIDYSIKNAASSDLDKFYKNCDFAIFKNKKFNDKDAKKLSKKLYSIDGFNKSIKTINFFIVDGKTMNKKYDLNASKYKDNDILIIFPLNLFKTNNSIVIAKQITNSRYFNDIVDNNEYKEVSAGYHKMSKQVEHLDKYFKSSK